MAKREPVRRDTKERILEAALAVFGERGYAASSVEDIAAAAGVTKGAVYYYFTDKADLAADLQQAVWDDLTTAALGVFDPEQPTAVNLQACFEVFVRHLRGLPAARGFLREAWFTPSLDPSGRASHEAAVELVTSLLEVGIRRGEMLPFDAEVLARVLLGALMEATLHLLGSGDPDATLAVIDHLVASLVPEPATSRRAAR